MIDHPAPEGARAAWGSWARKISDARNLASLHDADTLALAWRIAAEHEGALDQFNLGHLKP